MPPPPLRLTAPPALPGGLPEPTPADLAAFAPGTAAPPLAQPRLLAPPVSYASEPHLSHGDTTPRTSPDFYIPTMPSGLVAPEMTPDAMRSAVTAHAREARAPRMPSLLRAPVAPPVEQPPDFIDAMTASRAPMWSEPQDTPYDRERRAIESARSLEVQRGEMLARQAAERIDAEEAARRRADQLEVDRREAEGRAREAMQRSVDRLAEMRVEPGRYWRDAGAFGIIGNALAVGLGSIGEALGGGPERTVSTINASIDRDIRAQEQDIATAGQDVENRRGILSEVQREYQSREAAMEATRAIMLREAAAQAEMQAAQHGTAEVNANAARARDQLLTQAEQAQAAAERAEVTGALEMREQLARIRGLEARALRDERRAMGGGGGAPQVERRTAPQLAAFDAQVASGVPRQEAWTAAGLSGVAPEGNPITTEQRAPLDALDAALREVESLVPAEGDIEGAGTWDGNIPNFMQSDNGLRLRVALEDMIDLYGRVRSGAAITEAEREAFRRNLIGGGTERELRVGLAQLRREIAARLGRGGARAGGASMIDQAAAGMTQVE